MRERPPTLTELPLSPEEEQAVRMRKYALTMGIRVVCIFACLFVRGWWLLIPAIGAVFLPYVAVVFANAVSRRTRRPVERPGSIDRRDVP